MKIRRKAVTAAIVGLEAVLLAVDLWWALREKSRVV